MRSWLVVVIAVVVLGAFLGPALGQDLLDEPVYTVHFDDPLGDVIKQLREEHGIHIDADDTLHSTRVVVETEDANRVELLEAICRQVGAVYDAFGVAMPGRPRQWRLREGDWDTDPRPQAQVGDYTVAVREVSISDTWRVNFRWGDAESEGSDSHTLQVQFNVTSASDLAEKKLGAVRLSRALLDTGEEVEPANAMDGWGAQHYIRFMKPFETGSFAPPPEGATAIAELHGVLGVDPEVSEHAAEFGPGEVDAAKPLGDAEATLLTWDADGGEVRVAIDAPVRPGPSYYAGMDMDTRIWLLDANGSFVDAGNTGIGGASAAPGRRCRVWQFGGIQGVVATVRVEYTQRTDPLTDLPFVIRDIPLP